MDVSPFEFHNQPQYWKKVLCMCVSWKEEMSNAEKFKKKKMALIYPTHSWLNRNETLQKELCLPQATEGGFVLIT